jgi:CheY-like chemotaxis protein/HPt (histidine-containing phosphotransfer) domain-containing protein
VVEDNPVNQMVADGVLQRLGYTVVMTENGAEGVEAFALQNGGKPFDAVLMDCQMPVMDGYDATLAIRDLNEAGARVPIIAMTAAVVAEERQRCLDVGMNDFLAKPVDVGLLERTLDQWIPGGAKGEASAAPPTAAAPPEESAPPVMDRRRIAELLEGGAADPPMVLRMLDRFGSRAVSATVAMGEAVRAGDPAEVRQVAHGLRGSALNLGLVRLGRHCEGLELAAAAGELPTRAALTELEAEVAVGINELDAFAQTMTMAYDSAPSAG